MEKVVLSLEIKTPKRVWNRTVVSTYVPTSDELVEYYTLLCGLDVVSATCRAETVPETFNESLLSLGDSAPTNFPVHDVETTVENTEKRAQYTKYIGQLCEMERSRAALRVFTRCDTKGISTSDTGTDGRTKGSLLRTREWVNELLKSLNPDYNDEAIVSSVTDNTVPLGWILTPVVAAVRDEKGSRILLDTELGKKWERLLGTDLFPDLVISRRISTANWAFQHSTSDALVKATLDWYLACQDIRVERGISDWIARADYEMNMLFSTFKRIKIHERFLTADTLSGNDTQRTIFKLLSSVENQCLESALTNPEISPVTTEVFRHYMNYLFRGFGITKDVYGGIEMVNQILLRWGRGNLGFRANVDPLLESWTTMWNLVMRGHPTAHRVYMFLRTLDCWDPIESATISLQNRNEIGREWVNIFIDAEIVSDTKGTIRSTFLHEKTQEWCYKYLPAGIFTTTFGPMKLGPAFTSRGYTSVKRRGGRFTVGLRWKDPARSDPTPDAVDTTEPADTKDTEKPVEVKETEKPVIAENTIYLQV
jgi:hypothetical protein